MSEKFLQSLKGSFTLIKPNKANTITSQRRKGKCNSREILDKPTVITRQTKEAANIMNVLGLLPILNSFDLGRIDRNTLR